MKEIEKFKKLLEYFVAHLEYVNKSTNPKGENEYIIPILDKGFRKEGCGYNGDNIQRQIKGWDEYNVGNVGITIKSNYGNYKTKKCYLNWVGTGINIFAGWKGDKIDNLYIGYCYWWYSDYSEAFITRTISELELFKDNISSNLQDFCNYFMDEKKNYNNKKGEYYKREKEYYDSEKKEKVMKRNELYISLLRSNNNIVLTGAPGTGKTYLAKQIAQQMIFDEVKEKMTEDEQKQFNEQCGFVQFHPSYDYTDFVEGLRPKNDNGNVGFERKDGVFKEFCKKALLRSDSNDTSLFNGINDNPKVWKVSLSGTGGNEIRTYCKENNCIRIGWEEYGNVEDFSEYDFKESEVAKNFRSKGLAVGEKILKSFQNEMVIGDIVVSCYSEKETDAIGIITGDYEYIEDLANNYPRCRKVRWIWKGEPIDIMELNNKKKLTLSTIYKLDIDPISIKDFITKKGGYIESKKENRKYIFIIDEINRGEISKIFGELFFSIDPGYRGKKGKVQTQYQNMIEEGDVFKDGFYVPENVYIIGTMNDIDRSVESMDFAFRRRFAFKEVTATESQKMLDSDDAWKNGTENYKKPSDEIISKIKNRMDNLNNAIWHKPTNNENAEDRSIDGLSSAYHIGASYFLKLTNYRDENDEYVDQSFNDLWNNHLKGLLFEYLRGMQDIERKLDMLHKAYQNDKPKSELKPTENNNDDSTSNS